MTAVIVLAAVHLAVLGLWFLPRSVWEKLQAVGDRPVVMFRTVPMALAATWISFGILGPLVDAEIPVAVSPGVYDDVVRMATHHDPARRAHFRRRGRGSLVRPAPPAGLAIIGLVLVLGIAIGRLRAP